MSYQFIAAIRLMVSAVMLLCASTSSFATNTWQQSNGPYGGDVTAVAVDPTDSQSVYAGTLFGGVFKSTNGGADWTAVNSGLTMPRLSAGACVARRNDTLYGGAYWDI